MKKQLLCGAVAVAAVAGGLTPMAFAGPGGAKSHEHKVTFCHHTSSATNPYVTITTAKVALVRAHMENHDDRMAEDGVCPTSTGGGGGGGGGPEF